MGEPVAVLFYISSVIARPTERVVAISRPNQSLFHGQRRLPRRPFDFAALRSGPPRSDKEIIIMLSIQTPLFEAQDIRLGPIDHEKDPEVESKWTHDSEFMRLMELKPVRRWRRRWSRKSTSPRERDRGG